MYVHFLLWGCDAFTSTNQSSDAVAREGDDNLDGIGGGGAYGCAGGGGGGGHTHKQ